MALVSIGILVFEAGDWVLGVMAYALGAGMSASVVAVRKAYGGSYATLLTWQKIAEVSPYAVRTTKKLTQQRWRPQSSSPVSANT